MISFVYLIFNKNCHLCRAFYSAWIKMIKTLALR